MARFPLITFCPGVEPDFHAAWLQDDADAPIPVVLTPEDLQAAGQLQQDPEIRDGIARGPKRARVKGGQFRADDPATPETDEAWATEN